MKSVNFLCLSIIFLLLGCSDKNGTTDTDSNERMGDTERRMEAQREFLSKEREAIQAYIKDRELEMERTGTGLYYRIIEDSVAGETAKTGDVVVFEYDIYLLNGHKLYSSDEDGVRELMVEREDAEIGVHEALKLLGLGDEGLFILPSHLAFGVAGDQVKVPPKTPLAYEIKILQITQAEE